MKGAAAKNSTTFIGIDPGTNIMGYGIICCSGNQMEVVSSGVVKMKTGDDHSSRLKRIYERTVELLSLYQPDEMALEDPFFGKNVQSMLKLGRAQGMAMAAAFSHGLPVQQYAPRKIKMSITGKGNASKEQVAGMLKQLLNMDRLPQYLDATDGLAVAVCHHFQQELPVVESSYGSWKSFLTNNPDRLK